MMARSTNAPFKGRIQKRKTNHLQIITFGLQRTAGPYKRAKTGSDKPYSITSSARARRDAGTSRPSDFVVLRLMTSAYLEGCSIVLLENAWAWKTSTWLTWRKARFSS